MTTPSQAQIECKLCGTAGVPHKQYRTLCRPCAGKRQQEYQRQYRERLKLSPRLKTCTGCGQQYSTAQTGRVWRCVECSRAYLRDYMQTRKAKGAEYSRAYRARQGDAYRERMRVRRDTLLATLPPEKVADLRQAEAGRARRSQEALKAQVFAAYGGYLCSCCGVTERHFLSIDHVANNGAEQKRNRDYTSGTGFYQWLRKNGFPSGYQVLCLNCNIGKHRNGGVCPHQSEKV